MGRDGEDTDGEDGYRIIDEQAVRHLFGSFFVLSHEEPFGVDELVQYVRVQVVHHRLFHSQPVWSWKRKQEGLCWRQC